jgi:hypothetical protein
MRDGSTSLPLVAPLALACVLFSCGGRVAPEPGDDGVRLAPVERSDDAGAPAGDAAGDDSGLAESCAALADCCSEFSGATAEACNTVAEQGDQEACAAQVGTYQTQGECQGQ